MKKINFWLYLLLATVGLSFAPCKLSDGTLVTTDHFPQWLSVLNTRTDQTSGIAFLQEKPEGKKHFLLADDIGDLYYFTITSDTVFAFKLIKLSDDVMDFLNSYPKKDFEEIAYDAATGKVYLSIEGNGTRSKELAGIFELTFKGNDITSCEVTAMNKLNIQPQAEFLKYVDNNIGFEGFTAGKKFFFAALEGFQTGPLFADSTLIYVIDKQSLKIVNTIYTKKLGITTACGLYAESDNTLWGIDRNQRRVFKLELTASADVSNCTLLAVPVSVPNYPAESYFASLESITIDNEHFIYCVDDPWKKVYTPSDSVLKKLDPGTAYNFKTAVPIIHRFRESSMILDDGK